MSEDESANITQGRISLIQFLYAVAGAIFGLGVWVSVQQMTDQYQSEQIAEQARLLKEYSSRQDSMNSTLIRIDEKTNTFSEQWVEIKQTLKDLKD